MKLLRRVVIAIAGGTVLIVGVLMIVLPGPAILVIPAGLAILALEFAWAGHLLRKIKAYMPGKKGEKKVEGSSKTVEEGKIVRDPSTAPQQARLAQDDDLLKGR